LIGLASSSEITRKRNPAQVSQRSEDAASAVLDKLVVDQELDPKLKDHALTGEMSGFRECHLKPDLLLIYAKAEDPPALILMRIGSHSELF